MKRSLADSIANALDGLIYAFRTEKNLKIHAAITVAVLTVSLCLDLTNIELLFVVSATCLVLFAELVNTAMETLVNLLTLQHHPLAKIVKDVAAGAVLITCANAAAVGYLVIVPAFRRSLFLGVLDKIKQHEGHGIILVLIIIAMAILVTRALRDSSASSRSGVISGHAALAFALSTAILLVSKNLISTVLAFGLALLVGHSRIEANVQRWVDVVAGALIGILSSLIVFELFYSLRGP
ncbi:MAG: diacylglycerol kinase [Candidatus Xenobia bacterium]